MTSTGYTPHQPPSYATQLAANVKVAMQVAGPADAAGNTRPLRSVALQRRTGIARSTLRAMTSPAPDSRPNPDLHTVSRLAEALGVPVAFLLMRPEDWRTLCRALNDMPTLVTAAEKLIGRKPLAVPAGTSERVLRECRLQPDAVPYGSGANPVEIARVEQRNERRRRASHVLGGLALRGLPDPDAKVFLTALAAALAHQLSFADEALAEAC